MKSLRQSSWRWVLYGAGVLLFTTALTLMLLDFVRNKLLDPFGYTLWVIKQLILSIPQSLFWGAVEFAILIIALRTFLVARQARDDESKLLLVSIPAERRVGYWRTQLKLARSGNRYSRARLARQLSNLLVGLLAHQNRVTPQEIRQRIEAGELELDQDLKEYLLIGFRYGAVQSENRFERMLRMFPEEARVPLAKLFGQPIHPLDDMDNRIEAVVRYLENNLEVKHDR